MSLTCQRDFLVYIGSDVPKPDAYYKFDTGAAAKRWENVMQNVNNDLVDVSPVGYEATEVVGKISGGIGIPPGVLPSDFTRLETVSGDDLLFDVAGDGMSLVFWARIPGDYDTCAGHNVGYLWRWKTAVGNYGLEMSYAAKCLDGVVSQVEIFVNVTGFGGALAQAVKTISVYWPDRIEHEWHMCAALYSNTTKRSYARIDDQSMETSAATADLSVVAAPMQLLLRQQSAIDFYVDEAGLWVSRVLTTAELDWLWNSGAGRTMHMPSCV